mmetsp:Transcript_13563/g.34817  ORF Transcript_13563/g.34817 Transcript_13563/m.34817 type:complete len:100 (+) Transcript_13563:1575-1874(+)
MLLQISNPMYAYQSLLSNLSMNLSSINAHAHAQGPFTDRSAARHMRFEISRQAHGPWEKKSHSSSSSANADHGKEMHHPRPPSTSLIGELLLTSLSLQV